MAGTITVRKLTTVLDYKVDAGGLALYKKQLDSLAKSIGLMSARANELSKSVKLSSDMLSKSADGVAKSFGKVSSEATRTNKTVQGVAKNSVSELDKISKAAQSAGSNIAKAARMPSVQRAATKLAKTVLPESMYTGVHPMAKAMSSVKAAANTAAIPVGAAVNPMAAAMAAAGYAVNQALAKPTHSAAPVSAMAGPTMPIPAPTAATGGAGGRPPSQPIVGTPNPARGPRRQLPAPGSLAARLAVAQTFGAAAALGQNFHNLSNQINGTNGPVRNLSQSIGALQKDTSRMGETMNRGFSRSTRQFSGFLENVMSTGAVFAGINFAKRADEWSTIRGRIGLVSSSDQERDSTMDKLYNVSNESRSSFGSVAEVYNRIATNRETLGLDNDAAIKLSGNVAKAIALSGGSAMAQKGLLTQVGQAFGSNNFAGDELKSILEQGGYFAKIMADGLGIPIGKLKEMGKEGKLAGKTIAEIFAMASDRIAKDADKMPKTFANGILVLNNYIDKIIDKWNQQTKASAIFFDLVKSLEPHIEKILIGLSMLAGMLVAMKGAEFLLWLWAAKGLALAFTGMYFILEDIYVWLNKGHSVLGRWVGEVDNIKPQFQGIINFVKGFVDQLKSGENNLTKIGLKILAAVSIGWVLLLPFIGVFKVLRSIFGVLGITIGAAGVLKGAFAMLLIPLRMLLIPFALYAATARGLYAVTLLTITAMKAWPGVIAIATGAMAMLRGVIFGTTAAVTGGVAAIRGGAIAIGALLAAWSWPVIAVASILGLIGGLIYGIYVNSDKVKALFGVFFSNMGKSWGELATKAGEFMGALMTFDGKKIEEKWNELWPKLKDVALQSLTELAKLGDDILATLGKSLTTYLDGIYGGWVNKFRGFLGDSANAELAAASAPILYGRDKSGGITPSQAVGASENRYGNIVQNNTVHQQTTINNPDGSPAQIEKSVKSGTKDAFSAIPLLRQSVEILP